ncbi:hypothetical protein ACI65C_005126 [Semiaphis heraclei]
MAYNGVKELLDHDYLPNNIQFWPVGERPQSYILIAGVHKHEHIIKDNLGFLYFKSKRTEEKVYLKCKENITRRCQATGSISSDENNKQFQLRRLHNHQVQPSNTEIRELRSTIGQRCVQQFARPYSARSIYVEAIVSHPEGAENYTFSQAAERMRQIRKSVFPPTPRNLQHFNELMQMENNKHFNMSFQKQPSLYITISGCDGTFKTVPKTLDNDCYQLFTFQVIYRNVSFPMVYAILTGKTEEIYVGLFKYVRSVLPLQYDKLTIITDFELGLINAIQLVFPESSHQGCYFHYCQVLALPYLPPNSNDNRIPSILDGFNNIIMYIVQHTEIAEYFHDFMYQYVFGYWSVKMRPEAFTVFEKDIRTNNYLESYHAALLRFIKPHPKIWEFIGQIRFLESQNNLEFKQVSQNLKIRSGDSSRVTIRNKNTLEIRRFMQDMVEDDAPDRILTFLRRAGHKVDGYITQQIGPYPDEQELLLEEVNNSQITIIN